MKVGKVLLVLGVILVAASASPGAAKQMGKKVRLGALLPLGGFIAYYGDQQRLALRLAIEDVNGAGGIGGLPVEVIWLDTASRGDTAIQALNKLAKTEKVLIVFGPLLSSNCGVVFPQGVRLKIPVLTASCAFPGLAGKHRPWSFANSSTSDKVNAASFSRWLKDHDVKTVGIIYDNKDRVSKGFGKLVAPALLKKHGVKIIAEQTFITEDIDYSAQITAIKAAKPDALVLGATPAIGARVVTTARRLGLNVPVLGDMPISGEFFLREGKQHVEGTYTSADLWYERPDARQQAFQERFKEKHLKGDMPHTVSMAMYDNVFITKMCIEKYGVTNDPKQLDQDRDKIRRCLQELKDFPGLAGNISIDEHGDAVKTYYLLKAEKGKWRRLQ